MARLQCFIFVSLMAYVLGYRAPHVTEPCPHLDQGCLERFFLASGLCSKAVGRVPDVLKVPRIRMYLPSFNGTILDENIVIKGLKPEIVKFFVNHETDRAVLVFRVTEFDNYAETTFTYLPPAREPISATTTTIQKHGNALFTVLFEGTRPINLRNSFTYVTFEALPQLTVGHEPMVVKDPGFQAMYAAIFSNLMSAYSEAYLTKASYFSNIFIQYTLCDFGIREKY